MEEKMDILTKVGIVLAAVGMSVTTGILGLIAGIYLY